MTNWELIKHLNESHISIAWDELNSRFGFKSDHWKKEFNKYLLSLPRNTTELDAFVVFGNKRINPVLNSILGRNELAPTFNNFLSYIIKKAYV